MYRTFRMLIVSAVLVALWVIPGSAFQLFGANPTSSTGSNNTLSTDSEGTAAMPAGPPLALGDGGELNPADSDSMNIWIPGLGVVGKMPKLDFGLEMLYGAPSPNNREAPIAADELKEFESDFAIKGTIKRKF